MLLYRKGYHCCVHMWFYLMLANFRRVEELHFCGHIRQLGGIFLERLAVLLVVPGTGSGTYRTMCWVQRLMLHLGTCSGRFVIVDLHLHLGVLKS